MNKRKVIERITAVLLSIFTIIMNVPTVYANDNDNVQIRTCSHRRLSNKCK